MFHNAALLLQVRKQEHTWKQSADEHATAVLALEAKLAGKQREVADLQEVNSSLFSRFQAMRHQLARTEDKLSHDKLKGGVTLQCTVRKGLLCLVHVHRVCGCWRRESHHMHCLVVAWADKPGHS